MQKKYIVALATAHALFIPSRSHAQYADSVVAYMPGTGFASNFTNSNATLGAPASGGSVSPFAPPFSNNQIVSIGAGGSLTLHLNTPVANSPGNAFGIDFLIFGNSFFAITSGSGANAITSGAIFTSSVSTRVEVSADGSSWFTLDPSLAPTVSTLFPTDGIGNPQLAVNPSLGSGDFNGKNLAGIRNLYNGSAGGTGFDLAWAQDGSGNSVNLESANFLRIDVLSGRTQIDAISVVPEPATWTLLLIGGGFLCLRSRKA
jgi:PEP-CTERM motif